MNQPDASVKAREIVTKWLDDPYNKMLTRFTTKQMESKS